MIAEAFVGRIAELHQLEANFRAARGGAFRLVVIGGEAGVGKSRLVREFLARADGVQQLAGACLPLENASLPYAPLVDALRGLVRGRDASELAAIAGPAGPELSRLVSELGRDTGTSFAPTEHDPAARQRFFDLLLGTIERLGRDKPLVFVIEDIHWSDAATRDLLRFLVRGLRDTPVLMTLTVRTGEAFGRQVAAFTAELTRLASATRMQLARLAEPEVRELLEHLVEPRPSPILVRSIYDRSDGNPFLIEQLARARPDGDDVPPALTEALGQTLANLSPAARAVLRVAASCGRRIDEELIVTASGLERQLVQDGLGEGLEEGILVSVAVDGTAHYEFRHALLRELVGGELLPSDRRRIHAAVARALEDSVTAPAAELAHHWEAAGEWQRAATAHLEAAAGAERVYAWVNAYQHYERCRALMERYPGVIVGDLDRAELLHRAAEAAYLAADYPAAIGHGREAIAVVSDSDMVRSGMLHERLRAYLWDSGDRRGAMASVEEALRLIPESPPSAARARVLAQSAAVMMHTGRLHDAGEQAAAALVVARRTGSMSDIGQAVAILSWIRVLNGEAEEGLSGLWQGVEAAERAGDAMGIALGRALVAYLLEWMGRTTEVRDVALSGHERLVELGLQRTYGGILLGYAALAATHLGTWDDARRWVDLGFEYDQSGPAAHWLRIIRGRLHALHARWEEAIADLEAARETELRSGGTEYGDQLVAFEAELAAWRESQGDARRAMEAIESRPPDAPIGTALVRASLFGAMAEADAASAAMVAEEWERLEDARSRARDLSRRVREGVRPAGYVRHSPMWAALLAALDAEVLRAEAADGPSTWEAVVAAWEGAANPALQAYAEYRWADALLRTGDLREQAYALIARARARCDALGAEAVGLRVDQLIRHASLAKASQAASPAVTAGEDARSERFSVFALGRLRIERRGVQMSNLGGAKAGRRQAQAFFAFLFDRGARGVTKDEVIELIWEEADLDRADTAFHRTLGGLRRMLEPGTASDPRGPAELLSRHAIRFEQDRYVLDERIVEYSDVRAFDEAVDAARASSGPGARRTALEEARRLYRGDYFDDCPYFGDSAEVEPTRSRLRERMVAVLIMLAELDEEHGQVHGAAELYQEALDLSAGESDAAAEGLARLGKLRPRLRVVENS